MISRVVQSGMPKAVAIGEEAALSRIASCIIPYHVVCRLPPVPHALARMLLTSLRTAPLRCMTTVYISVTREA